jgi:uncharacterized membrane protein
MPEPEVTRRSPVLTVLKWLLILVVIVVVAFVAIGLFALDGKYEVSREVTIKAPPEVIHKQVGDLQQWPNWLPFTKHDPSIKTTIEKPTGVGANQHWTGKDGTGKLTFTASDENKGIEYDMVFDEKWKSHGSMTYAKSGDDTRVTWRMTGQNDGLLGKWMAYLMPTMVGPMFDEGLKDLKKKVEEKPPAT